jgi:hypothetical protein
MPKVPWPVMPWVNMVGTPAVVIIPSWPLSRPPVVTVLDVVNHRLPSGHAAAAVWADDIAIPFLQAAADRFRAEGRLALLGSALASEAWAHLHRGAVLPGLTAAAESGRLAAETGLTLYVPAAKLAPGSVASAATAGSGIRPLNQTGPTKSPGHPQGSRGR